MAKDHQHRVRLTKLQKILVVEHFRANRGMNYEELRHWAKEKFELPKAPVKGTFMALFKNAAHLLATPPDDLRRKRTQKQSVRELDQCVIEYIVLCEMEGIALLGEMIMIQAKTIAELMRIPEKGQPKFGWAWLRHFEKRHGIKWRRAYGEVKSVDEAAAADTVDKLRKIIATYKLCDVFNMDESAFFHNAVPRGSICLDAAPALKQCKDRITFAFCTNADGTEKCPTLYIGRSVTPRWLGDKPDHVHYCSAAKAWMTTALFQDWLTKFNNQKCEEGRHVLLLVDNASSLNVEGMKLSNVRIEFLPPNTTSKIQPMDQGIIYCVKRAILRAKMHFALDKIGSGKANPYKVSLLQAIEWCEEAWADISEKTIRNCWLHSGLLDREY